MKFQGSSLVPRQCSAGCPRGAAQAAAGVGPGGLPLDEGAPALAASE